MRQIITKELIQFSNINSELSHYPEGTILLPLTPYPEATIDNYDSSPISSSMQSKYDEYNSIIDDEDELEDIKDLHRLQVYRELYDERLFRPYIKYKSKLRKSNVKKIAGNEGKRSKGVIDGILRLLDWIDNFQSKLSPKVVDGWYNIIESGYKKYIPSDIVVWLPLWEVGETHGIKVNVVNRLHIIIT